MINDAIDTHVVEGVIGHEALVHQQGLHGVTRGGVVSLGVKHNLDCLEKIHFLETHKYSLQNLHLVQVTVLVKVSVTNTISVTQNRDGLGPLLDGPES